MPYKPLVGKNYKTGQQLNREPWIIEQDAFVTLFNAYVWRGRVKKKYGVSSLGQLQYQAENATFAGTLDVNGNFDAHMNGVFTLPANAVLVPGSITVSIPGQTWTEVLSGGVYTGALTGSLGGTGNVNYATTEIAVGAGAGSAGANVSVTFSVYPELPVMGLLSRVLPTTGQQPTTAFDTLNAYTYNNTTNKWQLAQSALPTTWSGTDAQLFWGENGFGALWVTNGKPGFQAVTISHVGNAVAGPPSTLAVTTTAANTFQVNDTVYLFNTTATAATDNDKWGVVTIAGNPFTISNPTSGYFTSTVGNVAGLAVNSNINVSGDGIRWYDGTTWQNYNPLINPVTVLMGAGIIVFYRGRMVFLDTFEGTGLPASSATEHPQRARWLQNGTPYYGIPIPVSAQVGTDFDTAREDIVGKGGFIDCPTTEKIISACFLRDTLIVGFEYSKWKLRYTNNELLPFIWERIDVELGDEGRFSGVKFDKFTLGVGNRGITACDGVGVNRIDPIIPDIVFNFSNENSGPERIAGIRDFEEQVVYWTFPNDSPNIPYTGKFPNRVLLYNYMETSWALLSDCFTTYGYYQSSSDATWGDTHTTWGSANNTWGGKTGQALNPVVIAGNQQGFVLTVQNQVQNDPTLYVQAVTPSGSAAPTTFTVNNHNLQQGQIIICSGFLTTNAALNGQTFQVVPVDANTLQLFTYNTSTGIYQSFVGGSSTYIGQGYISLVDNFKMLTKKFNPFLDNGQSVRLKQVDFYVDGTGDGRFAVDLYISDEDDNPANPPHQVTNLTTLSNPLSNRVETFANAYEPPGQDKYWHSLYNIVTGNLVQISLYYGDQELNTQTIFEEPVVIHSIAPYMQPGSGRLT